MEKKEADQLAKKARQGKRDSCLPVARGYVLILTTVAPADKIDDAAALKRVKDQVGCPMHMKLQLQC